MVVCKYFQQGTCRFGQYCRYEHVGGFAGAQATANKGFGDGKSIVLGVAEEVLAAERGGQWLLSCFGPFKEGACIPGMDDVAPEEVRWEMYQAQKNGSVDQTKLQFQQLCQAMTTKREALKNPTHETAEMLDKLQKANPGFQQKSNFVLGSSQLGASMPGAGVFAKKSFGTNSGTFGEGFGATPAPQSSIFGRSSGGSSFFGATPTFGATAFAPQPTNSIFGGGTKPAASVFGGSQPMPGFGTPATVVSTPATQTTSSFNTGGQNLFSSAQQQNGIFAAAQSTSVFGGGTTASSFPSQSVFGGGTATQGQSTFAGANMFGQKSAFGQDSIFGGSAGAFTTASASAFGGQGIFTNAANTFGQPTTTPSFGAPIGSATFAPAVAQNVQPSATSAGPFGNPPISSASEIPAFAPPGGAAGPFGTTSTTNSPFAGSVAPPENFGNQNPFMSSAPANTTANAAVNPFLQKSESFTASPFAGAAPAPAYNDSWDLSIYTIAENLSEADKSAFTANSFTLRSIPILPPTIELR